MYGVNSKNSKNILNLSFLWVTGHLRGDFGFNTDILVTNPINLSVVLGVLILSGKGACASCLFQE